MDLHSTKQTAAHLLIITAIAGTVFFTNLGQASLWDRDEPRNAGCAVEMMQRGDWIVPIFNDELRHQKPALLYWLMMSAYAAFGVNEFAARFWSAILAIGTVLSTYGIARRLLNPSIAFLSATVLSTSLMFDVAARAATPDSLLIFFGTASIMIYVVGTFLPRRGLQSPLKPRVDGKWFPQNRLVVIALYGTMGLGVLAKGPIGLVMPTAIIGMFLLIVNLPQLDATFWRKQGYLTRWLICCTRPFHPLHFLRTCWSMRPFTAVVTVLLIAAPWYVWVGLRTDGDFLRLFFLNEHYGRATTAFENHAGGIWYYPLAILIGFFPWSIFLGPMTVGLDRQFSRQWKPELAFLLCWIGVQVGLFTFVSTKLPSYVTPCYPALAILTAHCLYLWIIAPKSDTAITSDVAPRPWFALAIGSLVPSGILVTVGLAIACLHFFPGQWWLLVLGVLPAMGGTAGLWFMSRGHDRAALVACTSVAVLFATGLFGWGTVAVSSHQESHLILDRIRQFDEDVAIGTYGCLESSWVFYAGRPIFELSADSTQNDTATERKNDWSPKPRIGPPAFVQSGASLFITTDSQLDNLLRQLPDDYRVIQSAEYFLRNKKLLLVGNPTKLRIAGDTMDSKTRR